MFSVQGRSRQARILDHGLEGKCKTVEQATPQMNSRGITSI
jgi:hypothetical protein